MDAGTILGVLQLIFNPVIKTGKWVSKNTQLLYYRWQDKNPPFNEITALRIARSTLGGSIVTSTPFRNLGSKNQFLAVVRKEHDDAPDARIYILEQAGGAYMQVWVSEELWGGFQNDSLKIIDLDNDGIKEIAFEISSFGSGAGSKSLYIYSMKKNQVFEVTENYNYSDASAPAVYPLEINAGEDEKFRAAIIKYASSRGFLQENELVDYDDPKFAISRWHKENGERRTGKVSTHLYNGKPIYGASIHDELDTGDIIWTAYFKGPLFGYIKSKDKHFIPYSPQWVYEWVESFAVEGNQLWFICHCVPGLFSFDCKDTILRHYCGYAGYPLPQGDEIVFEDNTIYFYPLTFSGEGGEVIEIDPLEGLMECRPRCVLDDPHLPDRCFHKRHREDLKTLIE